MKNWIILFLGFYFVSVNAQDRIIKREIDNDSEIEQNLRITRVYEDSIYYSVNGNPKSIATKDVIAYKGNYKDPKEKYYFPKLSDERIYGVKNDQVFFKADYKFSYVYPELSKECFLAPYRIYDSLFLSNTKAKLYLRSNEIDEKVKIPDVISFYIRLKKDKNLRDFKAHLYYTSPDTTNLIVKIEVNETEYVYCFKNDDIDFLEIESTGALVGRVALHTLSKGKARSFSQDRWLTRYEFTEWHISK